MPLAAGSKLGPYEIQSPIGAGGMGEVYRATDTRLDRTVAVKILPSHLSANPEARQRFEREARAISSLNHPHICTLHDVGSQDGTDYLVMEYVQGETLDARLKKGPLPLKQALECGMQICDALDKAHRAGIVHRDLKPGNIMLTASGAKLLDFGLAKPTAALLGSRAGSGSLTPSTPTLNLSALSAPLGTLTQQGTVVGTFQYMAPEVLQGQEADPRSDIFSFGCVLYEMLTARRAFEGKSQISVASAILEKEPEPLTIVQPMCPAALDHVVSDCLAKNPESRWQNAADLARELRWISNNSTAVTNIQSEEATRGTWRERLLWAGAATLLVGALMWSQFRGHEAAQTIRSFLPPPADAGFDFTGDFSGPPVINADGSAIAFCARMPRERASIWVQSLGDTSAKKLEGTTGASFPFWSPDGKSLGFFADGHLKKIPASGGPVTVLADATNARGGTWNQDNVIVYDPDYRDSLWKIAAAGGSPPQRLTVLENRKHTTHRWPRFLPDGKHFLFFATNHSGGSEQGIYWGSLADGSYKHILDSDSDAQYASGYLIYHLQSELLAQKFDPVTGKVSGDPVALVNFVEYDAGTWHTTFSVSQNGLLIYEPGSNTPGVDLVWLDRSGKVLGKIADRQRFKGCGRLSPDGKRLAVAMGDPEADIWVFDLLRGSHTRLTFGGGTHITPSWTPDGQRVVFVQQADTTFFTGTSLHQRLANGGGQDEVLVSNDRSSTPTTFMVPQPSPDGQYIVHIERVGPGGGEIWALPTSGDKKPFPVVQPQSSQVRIIQSRLSPDGHWLAYSSTESGPEEIYITHFPSGKGKWQVSQGGATFPAWRGDSKEIYFVGADGDFHAVGVSTKNDELELEPVRTLFPTGNYTAPNGSPYDVAPDGKRFVFAMYPENKTAPLVLVSNWTGDLKK